MSQYIIDQDGQKEVRGSIKLLYAGNESEEYIRQRELEEQQRLEKEANRPPTEAELLNLQIAQNTAETLELISTLNEKQKIEQAQSNAEMVELILSLQGGM